MLRLSLSPLSTRAARRTAIVRTTARMNSGPSKGGSEIGGDGTAPPKGVFQSPKPDDAKGEQEPTKKPYKFNPEDVFKAVRSGDIAKMQTAASDLVQHKWKEEYTLPAACLLIFAILWYWVAWTRRSVRRKCAATEAAVRQEAQQTVEMVRSLTQKWGKDIAKSDKQMKAIIEKNSTLTADIDRMTTALRSCSIRPTPSVVSGTVKAKVPETPKAVAAMAVLPPSLPSESTEASPEGTAATTPAEKAEPTLE